MRTLTERRLFHVLAMFMLATPLVLALAAPASAESRLWVSVASFGSDPTAHEFRDDVTRRLADTVSVVTVDTATGRIHRVVVGPFGSRDAASVALDDARAAGYDDAWIFTSSEDLTADAGDDYGSSLSGIDADYDSGLTGSYSSTSDVGSSSYSYEPVDPEPYVPPARSASSREEEPYQVPPEMVDTAPAGYQLHKLKRDP